LSDVYGDKAEKVKEKIKANKSSGFKGIKLLAFYLTIFYSL
jgi:hypothetical protein